jgi:hypothetical protein
MQRRAAKEKCVPQVRRVPWPRRERYRQRTAWQYLDKHVPYLTLAGNHRAKSKSSKIKLLISVILILRVYDKIRKCSNFSNIQHHGTVLLPEKKS